MIQRIQTLYLLLAIGLMVAFFFVPFGYTGLTDVATGQFVEKSLKAISEIGLIIPVGLSLLCMVIAIFAFKRHPAQKMLIILSALLIGACIGVVIYILTAGLGNTNPEINEHTAWGGGGLLLVAALLALLGAYRGVATDERILRNFDRLR